MGRKKRRTRIFNSEECGLSSAQPLLFCSIGPPLRRRRVTFNFSFSGGFSIYSLRSFDSADQISCLFPEHLENHESNLSIVKRLSRSNQSLFVDKHKWVETFKLKKLFLEHSLLKLYDKSSKFLSFGCVNHSQKREVYKWMWFDIFDHVFLVFIVAPELMII